MSNTARKNNIYGILGIIISILGLMSPRLFVIPILMIIAAFVVLGLYKDKSKVPSLISCSIGLYLFYSYFELEVKRSELYTVSFMIDCFECSIQYTNETGGENKEFAHGRWSRSLNIRGDQYITLFAISNYDAPSVITAKLSVNGKEIETKQSSGDSPSVSMGVTPASL